MNETYYVKPPAERNNNEERKGKKIYNEWNGQKQKNET
jgi:hypothetical protein